MRTTIDLDEDLLRIAKTLADTKHQTLSRVISDLALKGLQPREQTYTTRNGFPILQASPDSGTYSLEHLKEMAALDEDGRLASELVR